MTYMSREKLNIKGSKNEPYPNLCLGFRIDSINKFWAFHDRNACQRLSIQINFRQAWLNPMGHDRDGMMKLGMRIHFHATCDMRHDEDGVMSRLKLRWDSREFGERACGFDIRGFAKKFPNKRFISLQKSRIFPPVQRPENFFLSFRSFPSFFPFLSFFSSWGLVKIFNVFWIKASLCRQ